MKSETKLLAIMGAIAALGATFLTCNRDPATVPPRPPSTPAPLTEARFAELEKGTRHFRDGKDARFTVIEFADFQCPSCRVASELAVSRFGTAFPSIRFGFRHFPLDVPHPFARPAALLTEVAATQGKFWETYEALMKDPKEPLTQVSLDKAMAIAHVDAALYKKGAQDPKLQELVAGDQKTGTDFGVSETPTFFVRDNKTKRTMMVVGYRQLYAELKEIPGLPTPMPLADGSAPEPPK